MSKLISIPDPLLIPDPLPIPEPLPFKPFVSGCGICKPSTDYYLQQQYGGDAEGEVEGNYSLDGLVPQSNGKNYFCAKNYSLPLNQEFLTRNYGIDYATAFGGSKNKKEKHLKKDHLSKEKKEKLVKKEKSSKKDKIPKHKGGTAEAGATPMNQRFYDPNAHIANYGPLSGLDVESAYGLIKPGDVGVGMLAPYTTSDCPLANHNTDTKTGGSKKKKITKHKGGTAEAGATPMNQRFFDINAPIANYSPLSGLGVMSAYGPIEPGDVGVGMLAPYTTSDCPFANPNTDMKTGGSKKKKISSQKKNIKGAGLIPDLSSKGIDKVGNLVNGAIGDFTSFLKNLDSEYIKSTQIAESIKIGKERLIQGGKKEIKTRNMNIKKPISKEMVVIKQESKKPKSKEMVVIKQETKKPKSKEIVGIKQESKKPKSKEIVVIKPTSKDKVIKRSESKKPESKDKEIKRSESKKPESKKKNKKGGSNGSDFALTLNSRGPANYPDDMWSVPGLTWFRQFNKTGDYIPNSQLKYAATPLLAGREDINNVVVAYDEPDLNYISL